MSLDTLKISLTFREDNGVMKGNPSELLHLIIHTVKHNQSTDNSFELVNGEIVVNSPRTMYFSDSEFKLLRTKYTEFVKNNFTNTCTFDDLVSLPFLSSLNQTDEVVKLQEFVKLTNDLLTSLQRVSGITVHPALQDKIYEASDKFSLNFNGLYTKYELDILKQMESYPSWIYLLCFRKIVVIDRLVQYSLDLFAPRLEYCR